MTSHLRQIAKRSKTMMIAYKIYENWGMKKRFESGNTESHHGSTHSGRTLPESLGYINAQFDDYLTYSGLSMEQLKGKRIFELGFGDNVGVALRFLAAGAGYAVCLDKFYSKRDLGQERTVYLALRETLDRQSQQRFDEAIDLSSGLKINSDRLKCIYGVDVEGAEGLSNVEPFDLIVSRGAIQDVYEPDAAFAAMDKMLIPGGYMLHKIDLSDQGMFRDNGMNPLTFLTIPDYVYRLMAINSGKPNRKSISYYRQKMAELGYDARLLITEIIGRSGKGDLLPHKDRLELNVDYSQSTLALVNGIRPRLIPRYRSMSDEDLIVGGIFIIARKSE